MPASDSSPVHSSPEFRVHGLRAGLLLIAGIVSGAFGAHAMKAVLDPDGLDAFATASRYLLFMGGAIIGAAAAGRNAGLGWVEFGTLLFSGSIFLLLFLKHQGWPYALLGPVTPIGGTLMIAGWGHWVWSLWRGERG